MKKARRDALRRIRLVFCRFTQKVLVRRVEGFSLEEMRKEGSTNKNNSVLTWEEIQERIFKKLIKENFRFHQVAPKKANCVVRIFRKELEINGIQGGICGAVCFVKNPFGKWISINENGEEELLDFDNTYNVEYITENSKYPKLVKASCFDMYLKVTEL